MNKKVLFGLVAVALFSSLLAIAPTYAASNHRGLQTQGTEYEFELMPDGWMHYWSTYSGLGNIDDRDCFIMHVLVDCKITIIVADCCVMGDTIAVFYPMDRVRFKATSPSIIMGTHFLKAGTYKFYVGYTSCPGGFPAGYNIWLFAHI